MSYKSNSNAYKILATVGLFAFIYSLVKLLKHSNEKKETKVISEEGIEALEDPSKVEKIERAIRSYHEKKEWDDDLLDEINSRKEVTA